jgi:hypothetical protein
MLDAAICDATETSSPNTQHQHPSVFLPWAQIISLDHWRIKLRRLPMQFRVTVPNGIEGGQIVSVDAAGAQFNVRVPKEVKTGDSFLFTITPEQLVAAKQEDNKQQQQPQEPDLDPTLVIGTTKTMKPPVLFHDYTDLGMALCLGFIIGFSIVFGFLLGVLYVTESLPVSQQPPW